MVEPRLWGDMRHQGHARSLWGTASTSAEPQKPMWFGQTEGLMNGEAAEAFEEKTSITSRDYILIYYDIIYYYIIY